MSVLGKILGLALMLSSCSGEYHLRKAYQKGALEDSLHSDTTFDTVMVQFDTTVFFYRDSAVLNITDTIICDSLNRPVLISGGKSVDSETAKSSVTLEGGVLNVSTTCKAIRDSLRITKKKNVAYVSAIKHERKVNSDLTNELKRSNEIKGKWALAAVVFAIALCLIALSTIIRKIP